MEGDDCYKFSTVQVYVAKTNAKPIKTILEVGANVGIVSLQMHAMFPDAKIYSFEVVEQWFQQAAQSVAGIDNIKLYHAAMSSQHLFEDDLGVVPRAALAELRVLKGLPAAGGGWVGGSTVVAADNPLVSDKSIEWAYEKVDEKVQPIVLQDFLTSENIEELDFLKIDCEGCEHHVLGCASLETLRRIRFIGGEYHSFSRFYNILKNKLFQTHKVNLIGSGDIGCFFAERRDGERDGILLHNNPGMLELRPWLHSEPVEWHLYNPAYVTLDRRAAHAMP